MEEIWKDIKGYEGIYKISNFGKIKSLERKIGINGGYFINKEKILKPNQDSRGYPSVRLRLNGVPILYRVHRLLAIAFIPNSENKPCVNHKNGIKSNNSLDNLEWCTQSENIRHAIDTGLKVSSKGEKHGRSKLTDIQVVDIKERLKKGERNVSIAKTFNISRQTISEIKCNKIWKHLY